MQPKENGQKSLKQSKINKKFIYLISPNKIKKSFFKDLAEVLKMQKVSFFQLRLKKENFKKKLKIGRKIKKICKKFNVKFLINDDVYLAKKLDADGCHLGQKDMDIIKARKLIKNKIIGITCHNSLKLAKKAIKKKADYLAFGSFYRSKTKTKAKKANLNIIKWAKKNIRKPVVAIGGINNLNYKKLLSFGAKYIAISSYIWDNPKLKPEIAIRKFK